MIYRTIAVRQASEVSIARACRLFGVLKTSVVTDAMNRAIALRNPAPGLVVHTDRGSQYCSQEYMTLLKAIAALPSMSGKGNCYDNAVA